MGKNERSHKPSKTTHSSSSKKNKSRREDSIRDRESSKPEPTLTGPVSNGIPSSQRPGSYDQSASEGYPGEPPDSPYYSDELDNDSSSSNYTHKPSEQSATLGYSIQHDSRHLLKPRTAPKFPDDSSSLSSTTSGSNQGPPYQSYDLTGSSYSSKRPPQSNSTDCAPPPWEQKPPYQVHDSSYTSQSSTQSNSSNSATFSSNQRPPCQAGSYNSVYHSQSSTTSDEYPESSGAQALPTRCPRVIALLARWEEEGNLHCSQDVENLRMVLRTEFQFDVKVFTIKTGSKPRQEDRLKKAAKLIQEVERFVDACNKGDTLIFYYGGHGTAIKHQPLRFISDVGKSSPKTQVWVPWGAICSILENAKSNVLVLLDCCFAGSSSRGPRKQIMTILAACDDMHITPGPGPTSFTSSLIETLYALRKEQPFSVSTLEKDLKNRLWEHHLRDPTDRRIQVPVKRHFGAEAEIMLQYTYSVPVYGPP